MDQKMGRLSKNKLIAAIFFGVVAVAFLALLLMMQQQSAGVQLEVPSTPGMTAVTTLPDASQGEDPTVVETYPRQPVTTMPQLNLLPALPQEATRPEQILNTAKPFLKYNEWTKKNFKKVNGYITCTTEECWLGIDVSVYQEDIDWEQVAAAGVKFVMVRLAYRGWRKSGPIYADTNGLKNIAGAEAAGLKVGVYFYSQATSVEEAIEEAQFILDLLDGRALDMPVVFDWELPTDSTARTRRVKAKTIHAMALAFCEEVRQAGYRPMVYFNQRQGKTKYDLMELRAAGIELWLAMYSNAMTYAYKVQMWQYTDNGRVPGIEGRVDIDLYFPNS